MANFTDSSALLSSSGNTANAIAGLSSMSRVKSMNMDQINAVSKDFESMFVSQMVGQMFGDSQGTEAYGNNDTSEVYKTMMVDEYSKQITRAGGIGIADYVKQELLKLQEK